MTFVRRLASLVALLACLAAPVLGAETPKNANPFRLPGHWYRGNTHSHTTRSDGKLSVEDRCALYKNAGYDFLVITDHNKPGDLSAYGDEKFLVISGAELHPANKVGGSIYHFVAINVREPIDNKTLTANELIEAVKRQGGEVVIAHPYWSGHALSDYLPLRGYLAMEVYNHITEKAIGKGYSEQTWDELLDRAGPVFGLASDDSHRGAEESFGGWIMVKAQALTLDAIMAALRAGAFYSTQGPEIKGFELTETTTAGPAGQAVKKRVVRVRCSPARSIVFKCQGSLGRNVAAPTGGALIEAEFALSPWAKYVRVEITDTAGKQAWSNPIFLRATDAAR